MIQTNKKTKTQTSKSKKKQLEWRMRDLGDLRETVWQRQRLGLERHIKLALPVLLDCPPAAAEWDDVGGGAWDAVPVLDCCCAIKL